MRRNAVAAAWAIATLAAYARRGKCLAMVPIVTSEDLQGRWKELARQGCISSTSGDFKYGVEVLGGKMVSFVRDAASGESAVDDDLFDRVFALKERGHLASLSPIRRLRPPASPRLGELPPHEADQCSFCSGPLSLTLRERVGVWTGIEGREWDVHYNISPMVKDGHFLLVPSMALDENRRPQALTESDCMDMVFAGLNFGKRMCVNYNSPKAGASQNHIHIHCWQNPPYPYAVQQAKFSEAWRSRKGEIIAALLPSYPAFCICLQPSNSVFGGEDEAAKAVGSALFALVKRMPVHNVAVIGEQTFFFPRKEEVAHSTLPGFKIGSAQLLGYWVLDTQDALDCLKQDAKAVGRALGEVSMDPTEGQYAAGLALEVAGFVRGH